LSAALIQWLARGRNSAEAFSIIFVACAAFISPILLSFADVGVLMQAGLADDFWRAWPLRFLSNAASTIIFVPPIRAAARALRAWQWPTFRRLAEALLLAAAFVLIATVVFFAKSELSSLLPLMLCFFLPLLLWAAIRFGRG